MTDINRIININITRETTAVPQTGFGIPAIIGEFTTFGDRARVYGNSDALLTDGFASGDIVYKKAAALMSQQVRPQSFVVGRIDAADADLTTSLAAIKAANKTWYGFCLDSVAKADIEEAAAWCEANKKLYAALSGDAGIIDPASITDVGYDLKASGYARTFLGYHPTPATNQFDAAWLGRMLPTRPGAATWKFKTLAGVAAYGTLSDTAADAATAKNVNLYQPIGGVNITREGQVAVGEWIDVIHGVDWQEADMTARLYSLFVNTDKVSFTDPGITAVEAQIRASLNAGITAGLLTDEIPYVITMPTRKGSSPSDVAGRRLTNVKWTAYLAEALHYVQIDGVVTI